MQPDVQQTGLLLPVQQAEIYVLVGRERLHPALRALGLNLDTRNQKPLDGQLLPFRCSDS